MPAPSADRSHEERLEELPELAERYGTPFFLYDADAIKERVDLIRRSLKDLVGVYYAVKANPNLELLRAVKGVVDGLDISSGGELEQAALAGYAMEKLSFAGPAKTSAELTAAIERGVGGISIESRRELLECAEISRNLGIKVNVVIRVNPQLLNRSFGMKMGGGPSQFGVDEEEMGSVLEAVVANPGHLGFEGVHVYAGSQCFEASGVVAEIRNTLRIVQKIEADTVLRCRTINLGGGFGISHLEDGRELDLAALATDLVPMMQAFRRASPLPRTIIFELGRFLTAAAGTYVVRVIGSKVSRGRSFVLVDGGLHHHLAAAGTFGAVLRSNYSLRNVSRPGADRVRCTVAGPSCNPTDLLGIDVELPRPEHGDLIAVLKAGSYGFTASPLLFLGRQTPTELVRRESKVIVGRRPRRIVDFN